MKKRTLAALALMMCTALATAQPPPPGPPPPGFPPDYPVSVLDPQLPSSLPPNLRHQFLDELEHAIASMIRDVRVIRSQATDSLVVWADAGQLAKATRLAEQLKERLIARAGKDREAIYEREGAGVRTVVQVVVASTAPGKPAHALDPALAGPLEKAMGYTRFDVVGHAMAEGSVGQETKLFARMPWTDGSPVGLEVLLVPYVDDAGVRVKAQFGVHSAFEEVEEEVEIVRDERDDHDHDRDDDRDDEDDHHRRRYEDDEEHRSRGDGDEAEMPEIVEGSVQTTYRPRAGKPLVVGATPMGDDRSLLFVVTHSGEGVE